MGIKMEEATVVTKIGSLLPEDELHAFKKAWDSVAEASQTMPILLSRLRKDELEIKQAESRKGEDAHSKAPAFATNAKQKFQKK
jgi:hypothetical protein